MRFAARTLLSLSSRVLFLSDGRARVHTFYTNRRCNNNNIYALNYTYYGRPPRILYTNL